VDEQLMPNIGWVNVMPAADATVDISFGERKLQFKGHGYHDKVG